MRAAFILCFSILFFLAKGGNEAHAIVPQISQGHKYVGGIQQPKHQHTPFHKNVNAHIQKSYSSREVNYIEECQDEDESFSRKALTSFKQAAYFCYALLVGNIKTTQKLALPYCEHFSYTSSFKYLLLRVFRI